MMRCLPTSMSGGFLGLDSSARGERNLCWKEGERFGLFVGEEGGRMC